MNNRDVLQNIVDSQREVTLRAIDLVPSERRLFVYVIFSLTILCLAGGIIIAASGKNPYLVGFLSLGLVTILVIAYFLTFGLKASPDSLVRMTKAQVSGPNWARTVVKIPIEPIEALARLQSLLNTVHHQAISTINEIRINTQRPPLNPSLVRLNVFLPDTEKAKDGEVCGLFIPKRLHQNMAGFCDRGIRFRPHEGLTGRTFTIGEAGGARVFGGVGNKSNWEKVDLFPGRPQSDEWLRFILSDEQESAIERRLRWILSFPLRLPGTGPEATMGVLNIDCLDEVTDSSMMQTIAPRIEESIKFVSEELAKLPMVRISIRVEDVN